jgi:hypothetical protein
MPSQPPTVSMMRGRPTVRKRCTPLDVAMRAPHIQA